MNTIYRKARQHELPEIYLMGFDAWGSGLGEAEYLSSCRDSPKYRSGVWHVLEADGRVVSSLLVHRFPAWGDVAIRGIGSVATAAAFRGRGFGHDIVQRAVHDLHESDMAKVIFLYSDIGPKFYGATGFQVLPDLGQSSDHGVLMAWTHPGLDRSIFEANRERLPRYF